MWRAMFLALGIYCVLMGLEGLVLESASLQEWVTDGPRDLHLEKWMPWSILSSGAIVIIYSFTIPRRVKE